MNEVEPIFFPKNLTRLNEVSPNRTVKYFLYCAKKTIVLFFEIESFFMLISILFSLEIFVTMSIENKKWLFRNSMLRRVNI